MSQYLKPCGCDEDEYCDQCHPPRTAEAEIERLRSELETERGHRVADNAESRQEIERLRAALEQYADESNWNCAGVCVVCEAYSYAEQMIRLHVRDWWQGDDPGYAIAQAALEAAGGGGVMDDDREELLRRTLANQTRLLEKIERLRGALNRVRADVELWSVTGRHRNCDCRACEDLRAIAARAAEGGGGMSKKVPAWISEIVELAVVPPTECKNGWASRNWKVARDALEQNGCEWDQDYVVDVVGLLIDEIERLRALLNCRAGKLLQKGKTFVVVAVDEPYFSFVFDLIRKHEKHRGRWTDDDQRWYDQAIRESFEIESARAAGGGDE